MPITPPTELKPNPDPTMRTVELLEQTVAEIQRELLLRSEIRQREHANLQELIETRLSDTEELSTERVASIRREIAINEAHRLELKSDSEKTLNTATIAAEKAVQAALAAAEKARDQQTIASQLATTKAEEASKEQMKQQGETFSTDVRGLTSGFNDVKTAVSELRAEQRGVQQQVHQARDSTADMKPFMDAIAALTMAQAQNTGKQVQVSDHQAANRNIGLWIGLAITGGLALMALIDRLTSVVGA